MQCWESSSSSPSMGRPVSLLTLSAGFELLTAITAIRGLRTNPGWYCSSTVR